MEISLTKNDIRDIDFILENFVKKFANDIDFPALAWGLQTLLIESEKIKETLSEGKNKINE